MNDTPYLSLIISVYNRAEIVRLVLAAVGRQSMHNFEVIVADDGSGPAVAEVIRDFKTRTDISIVHKWQEDKGWRKNRMLNEAIRAAKSSYLVFIDGDCLPARDFLLDHWTQREDGRVLLGRRVEMSERWANTLTMKKVATGRFERIGLPELLDGAKGTALRLEDGIRLGNRYLRRLSFRKSERILGSNFSLYKKHMIAINGFDEEYEGPGQGEDSDVQYRLSLIGVTSKSLRNLAIQYHVYHKRTTPSPNSLSRFEEVQKSGDPVCRFGLEHIGAKSA